MHYSLVKSERADDRDEMWLFRKQVDGISGCDLLGSGLKKTEEEMEMIECSKFRFLGAKEKACAA